ncbi:MAG: HAD-IA family hydrolase, partial [Gammaproteobacteria bacterium]|nr:HAD-IA family hydrolase [Gammaproteobacteria bacterium]
MPSIHAITLDLDDTLWPIGPVIAKAEQHLHDHLHSRYPRIGEQYDVDRLRQLRDRVMADHPEIGHDFTALRHRTFELLLANCGYDGGDADALLEEFLKARHWVTLYPDVLDALQSLSTHLPLVAVSNGNADLKRLGLDHYFVGSINARGVGTLKPGAEIFRAACVALKAEPENVLHIGDHPIEDVLGAQGIGMKSAWMNRSAHSWTYEHTPDS